MSCFDSLSTQSKLLTAYESPTSHDTVISNLDVQTNTSKEVRRQQNKTFIELDEISGT